MGMYHQELLAFEWIPNGAPNQSQTNPCEECAATDEAFQRQRSLHLHNLHTYVRTHIHTYTHTYIHKIARVQRACKPKDICMYWTACSELWCCLIVCICSAIYVGTVCEVISQQALLVQLWDRQSCWFTYSCCVHSLLHTTPTYIHT